MGRFGPEKNYKFGYKILQDRVYFFWVAKEMYKTFSYSVFTLISVEALGSLLSLTMYLLIKS